jgi:hypothetical protein
MDGICSCFPGAGSSNLDRQYLDELQDVFDALRFLWHLLPGEWRWISFMHSVLSWSKLLSNERDDTQQTISDIN